MLEPETFLETIVRELVAKQAQMVEEMVEKMLQRGHGGIRITRPRIGTAIKVELDDTIPYGHIHEIIDEGN